MMSIMMHIFVLAITFCIIVPPTERDIENTKAVEKSVKNVSICLSVQQVKIM